MNKLIEKIVEMIIDKFINLIEKLLKVDIDGDGDIGDNPIR